MKKMEQLKLFNSLINNIHIYNNKDGSFLYSSVFLKKIGI